MMKDVLKAELRKNVAETNWGRNVNIWMSLRNLVHYFTNFIFVVLCYRLPLLDPSFTV